MPAAQDHVAVVDDECHARADQARLNVRVAVAFAMAEAGDVTIEVFDLQGRMVASRALGSIAAGMREAALPTVGQGNGVYMYRLRVVDHVSGAKKAELSGKMMVLQ